MAALALRRLLGLGPTLLAILCLSFCIVRLAPGSPFVSERAVAPELRAALEARYGLDQPLLVQLGRYLARVLLHGDLGVSIKYPQYTVVELLGAGLPVTLALGGLALLGALVVGIAGGTLAAWHHQRPADRAIMGAALLGISVPSFVLGPLLVLVFSLGLWWLPPAGWGEARHLALPALTLGSSYAATIARLTRTGVLEVLGQDFVRTARAKGLTPWRIALVHVLPGGLRPLLGYLGPAATGLLTGSVVVETLFDIPGIGPYFVDAAVNRDYFLVMGIVLLEACVLLVMNLLVDLAQAYLDPRVRDG